MTKNPTPAQDSAGITTSITELTNSVYLYFVY